MAPPVPDWLLPLRERAAGFASLTADQLVQALVTRYEPSIGIGWHRDRPGFEHVIGISLGAPAEMRFRRRRNDGSFDHAAPAAGAAGDLPHARRGSASMGTFDR
jgi:DNA oxidative demethylase